MMMLKINISASIGNVINVVSAIVSVNQPLSLSTITSLVAESVAAVAAVAIRSAILVVPIILHATAAVKSNGSNGMR